MGNLFPRFTPRQRLCCMLAASLADVDGLSILGGQNAWWDYHHTLGHNLLFGIAVCAALAAWTRFSVGAASAYLGLFHLHLLMDYYGSGPGWGIPYFWPLSRRQWVNSDSWEFFSWQNVVAAGFFIAWTVWIARRAGRTPLEVVMPNLDRQLVALARVHRDAEIDSGAGPRTQ